MLRQGMPTTSLDDAGRSEDADPIMSSVENLDLQSHNLPEKPKHRNSKTTKSGDACGAKNLYEGPPECDCCINWVEDYPYDHEAEPSYTADDPDFPLLLRYTKSHKKNGNKRLMLHSIVVQSNALKSFVRKVLESYPGIDAGLDELEFEAPFEPFFHRWTELERCRHEVDPEDIQQVELLRNVLYAELERDMKAAKDLASHGNITYNLLWTLYPPGAIAFGNINGHDQCFLVVRSSYEVDRNFENFNLDLAYLDNDGTRFGWRETSRGISGYKDTRKIAEMLVIPQSHQPDLDDTYDRLCRLGKKVVELSKGGYRMYKGIAELQNTGYVIRMDPTDVHRYVEGRIVVDPKGFHQNILIISTAVNTYPTGLRALVPGNEEPETQRGRLRPATKSDRHHQSHHSGSPGSEPEFDYVVTGRHRKHHHRRSRSRSVDSNVQQDIFHEGTDAAPFDSQAWINEVFHIQPEIFCRPVVRGYCMQSRSWAEFNVVDVTDIEWNEKAFDQLIMPLSRKRLLQALVEEQQNYKSDLDDFVQGKGQGLIILLAGPPGTGKTLTAESIADRLRMPLYMLGATQLGDKLTEIEDELSRTLRLAASWNAVLLLDEADAFLESRGNDAESRERNKRVATFLRVLEYYKGVLILTTNKSVTFDPAFHSRIHLTLRFTPLDLDARKAVWTNFLQPTGADFTDELLTELAQESLNGRQIKNIVKMSRLLAKKDRQPLDRKHLREVITVVKDNFGDNI